MAEIPYAGGVAEVEPTVAVPDRYVTPQATPAAFGAGLAAGGEKLGQGAFTAATFFGQIAADNATNEFQSRVTKILYGDPDKKVIGEDGQPTQDTGYMGLKGRAALDARPGVEAQIEALTKELRGGLTTQAMSEQFDEFTRRYRNVISETVGRQASSQANTWAAEVNAATARNSKTAITLDYNDDVKSAAALHDLRGAYVKQAQLLGGGPELTQDAIRRADQEGWSTRIERLALDDPDAAQKMADAHEAELGPAYATISTALESKVNKQAGIDAADAAWAAAGGRPLAGFGGTGTASGIVPAAMGGSAAGPVQVQQIDAGQVEPEVADAITAAAKAHPDVPAAYLTATAIRENSGRAKSPNSNYGTFQFQGETARQYGITANSTVAQNTNAAAVLAIENKDSLTQTLGREPTWDEVYLAHQQGAAGAAALINAAGADPNQNAAAVLARDALGGDLGTAQQHINGNGGSNAMSVGDFVKMQQGLYEQAAARGGGGGDQQAPADGDMPDKAKAYDAILQMNLPLKQQAPALANLNKRFAIYGTLNASDKARVQQQTMDTIKASEAGVEGLSIDEAAIRHLFPKVQAQKYIDEFTIANRVGDVIRAAQWASPQELDTLVRDIDSGEGIYSTMMKTGAHLATRGPGVSGADPDADTGMYFALRRSASDRLNAVIANRDAALASDPAAYVAQNPAVLEAAQEAHDAPNDANAAQSYVTSVLAVQGHLGVPKNGQHFMQRGDAMDMVGKLMSSEDPHQDMMALQQQYGPAWPQVYRDLVTLGKMPTAMQAVPILDDPKDAKLLTRWTREMSASGKDATDLIGAQGVGDIRKAIQNDTVVQQLLRSLSDSSVGNVVGVQNSIESLAFARAFYTGEAPAEAGRAAAKAFTDRYSFMEGGARIPVDRAGGIEAGAQKLVSGLKASDIQVPQIFGQLGAPTQEEYLASVQGAPNWTTSGTADGILLSDPYGRYVRNTKGDTIEFKFADAPAGQGAGSDQYGRPYFARTLKPGEVGIDRLGKRTP